MSDTQEHTPEWLEAAKMLRSDCRYCLTKYAGKVFKECIEKVPCMQQIEELERLNKFLLVKAKDQTLPEIPDYLDDLGQRVTKAAQQDMLKPSNGTVWAKVLTQ